MGLGSTAKKLQTVADQAEKLYGKMNEMREQLKDLRGTVEETGTQVQELDRKVERQQVVIEALAEERGIDVDSLFADQLIDDAEAVGDGEVAAPAEDSSADAAADAASGDGSVDGSTGANAQ